ncbi:MAG TPA: putative DNA-binding domain-containing protein [Opitutaceae bacterium]|jgi:hypothetical protein|nr:putative DNA-binding domain-containing protein [Opitutaceae bacterium]
MKLPARQRTTRDLKSLQRLMTATLVRPLTRTNRLQGRWTDGRTMEAVAASFIKPNDRLTSFERLQIYARCYWFRLLDSFYDDCPGLRAVLGEKKFMRLGEAYLTKYPSRSFTMRNLCSRLEKFIRLEPRLTAPHTALARDVVRFEWAQTVAFDGPSRPALTADDIADRPPTRLRLGLQPYLSLLALDYPAHDFVMAVKKEGELSGDASNTPVAAPRAAKLRRAPLPKRGRVYVAVHRHDNMIYYKRLEPAAYRILRALRAGRTIAQAVAHVRGVAPENLQAWFKNWVELGWFCRPG